MTAQRRRKLIEVALPLEAINRESAREKSIRHGHPPAILDPFAGGGSIPLEAASTLRFDQSGFEDS